MAAESLACSDVNDNATHLLPSHENGVPCSSSQNEPSQSKSSMSRITRPDCDLDLDAESDVAGTDAVAEV